MPRVLGITGSTRAGQCASPIEGSEARAGDAWPRGGFELEVKQRPVTAVRRARDALEDQALMRMSTPAGMLSEESESTVWGVGSLM